MSSSGGSGNGGGGHGSGVCSCCADAAQAAQALSVDNLLPVIDTSSIWCLNELKDGMGASIVKPWSARKNSNILQSCEGDDVLLFVPFSSTVRFRAFSLIAAGDTAPRRLRVYLNRDDLDLSNVNDVPPTQEFSLNDDSEGVLDYPTKYTKFQTVSSLTFYFSGTEGGQRCQINFLQLKGESTKGVRAAVNVVYEAVPNAADHKTMESEINKFGVSAKDSQAS